MNASQRRTFRRSLSRALSLTIGQTVNKGPTTGTLLRVSPTGGRNVEIKAKNNRRSIWPLSALTLTAS